MRLRQTLNQEFCTQFLTCSLLYRRQYTTFFFFSVYHCISSIFSLLGNYFIDPVLFPSLASTLKVLGYLSSVPDSRDTAHMVTTNSNFCLLLLRFLHSTSFKVFLIKTNLDTPVFLCRLMASANSSALQYQLMSQRKFQSQWEDATFFFFLGAIENSTLCYLGTQKLWKVLGIALVCHRLCKADGSHAMFRDISVNNKSFIFFIMAGTDISFVMKSPFPNFHSDFTDRLTSSKRNFLLRPSWLSSNFFFLYCNEEV